MILLRSEKTTDTKVILIEEEAKIDCESPLLENQILQSDNVMIIDECKKDCESKLNTNDMEEPYLRYNRVSSEANVS